MLPDVSRRSFLQLAGAAAAISLASSAPAHAAELPPVLARSGAGTGGLLPRGILARYLVDEDFYFFDQTRYPEASGWDFDQAGGVIAQTYGSWTRVTDQSVTLPMTLARPFQPQTEGALWWEFRVDPVGDTLTGVLFALRAGTANLVELKVDQNTLRMTRNGQPDLDLAPVGTAEFAVRVRVDLDAGRASVLVNGALVARRIPLLAAVGAGADGLLVASGDSAVSDFFYGPVRLYRDTRLNEQFIDTVPGVVPAIWASAATNVGVEVIEEMHANWMDRFCLRLTAASGGGSLGEAQLLKRGRTAAAPLSASEFRVRLQSGQVTYRIVCTQDVTVRVVQEAGVVRVLDASGAVVAERSHLPGLWMHIKVVIDTSSGKMTVLWNGKTLLDDAVVLTTANAARPPKGKVPRRIRRERPLPSGAYLDLSGGAIAFLDDVRVYWESPLPADYVPAPIAAPRDPQHAVGMSEFGGWRSGRHLGWDLITRFPERKPLLGWYDEGIPEVADWEVKWMAEAGIAFRMQCWFRPSGTGTPIKMPPMGSSLHDGYFEAEYSDAVKFAVMWENSGSSSNQADFRANIVPFLIEYYFRDPRYFLVDGAPVFAVYQVAKLVANFGTAAAAKTELEYLRQQVKAAGFPDLYVLGVTLNGPAAESGIQAEYSYSYDGFVALQEAMNTQRNAVSPVQVLATVSMGRNDLAWNRTMGTMISPEGLGEVCDWVRDQYIPALPAGHLGRRITMLGNWNEWGEGHFLQPSALHGFEYLDRIRASFSSGTASNVAPNAAQQKRLQKLYPYDRALPSPTGPAPAADGPFDVEWDFATDGDAEGWTSLSTIQNLEASGGALRGSNTARDPQFASPKGLGLEAADYPYLRIRMKSTPIEQGELYFITEQDGQYSVSKGTRFGAYPVAGEEYGQADLEMWRIPTWKGRIDQIRIDPIMEVGSYALDYVGLRHVPMTGPRVRLNGILDPQRRPEVDAGIVYASITQVIDATAGKVGVSPDGDVVHLRRGSTWMSIPATGTTITVNGQSRTIQAPARLLADGSWGLPASFYADVLGFDVDWDATTEELSITGTPVTITVAPDGSADFLTPEAANASIVGASAAVPYVIEVRPGEYVGREWKVKPFVTVRGTDRDTCILRGDLPDDATDAQITNSSTLWLTGTAGLENLTILAKNMRYAVHDEASGANVNAVHTVRNCRIEHVGNQAARDWRTANPGSGMSPDGVWKWDRPYGYGSGSGVHLMMEDCTLVGTKDIFYVHTNKDFTDPNVNELVRCDLQIIGGGFGTIVSTQSLGSGTADTVTLTDCTWTPGYISDTDTPWISQRPERQLSDKSEISHTVTGTAALGYLPQQRGKALNVYSKSSAAGVTIAVSGSAAPVLFGEPTTRAGGGGLVAYCYGSLDISGIKVGLASDVTVANTLGRRLGNRSGDPLTLVVETGGQSRQVVFDQDYTAVANSTIINTITQAIADIAGANEYTVVQNEYYPSFPARELTRTADVAIARWSAVVQQGSGRIVAAFPSATVAQVTGIAIDRMTPGATGRVLTSGYLHRSQLNGLASTAIPAGATVYLSDTNSGQFALSGTRAVATAIAADWVAFRV